MKERPEKGRKLAGQVGSGDRCQGHLRGIPGASWESQGPTRVKERRREGQRGED